MSRNALAVLAIAILSAACALQPGGASPQPTATSSPTERPAPSTPPAQPTPSPALPTPTTNPAPSSSAGTAFYLRGWYTQSLPPKYTFGWLPPVTISDGTYINGNVAVPAIYPGPLMILPVARPISDTGIKSIADDAQSLGLLQGSGDFTGGNPKPGAKLAQIELVVDGIKHELTGDPSLSVQCDRGRCTADPGTPQAFTAFWNELGMLDLWMPDQLGMEAQYTPERVAMLLTDPGDSSASSLPPTLVDWPLDTPLAGSTCLTLSGDELATMLPVLQSSNQLTVFAQGDTQRQPVVRALVPGEPSPCDSTN